MSALVTVLNQGVPGNPSPLRVKVRYTRRGVPTRVALSPVVHSSRPHSLTHSGLRGRTHWSRVFTVGKKHGVVK